MPPKKRTRTNAPAATTGPSSTIAALPAASSGGNRLSQNSSTGLLTMPVELLHLTATYLGPIVKVPHDAPRGDDDPPLPLEYRYRSDSLRALSQTCHYLRLTFLHMLWEYLNICVKSPNGAAFYKFLGDLLKRTSGGLAQEPELLSYIRTVNVVLTRYCSAEVLPPFARCLTQMPNMHTLQIIHAHTKMTTHLKNGFAGCSIPTVRKIIIPSWAHEVLRCCPEVTHVICNGGDCSNLVSAIAKSCKKVEFLEGFYLRDDKIMKRLVKAVPNLNEIKLLHTSKETIAGLAGFKKLSAITLTHRISQEARENGTYATTLPQDVQQCIEAAKRVLRKQTAVPPRLMICYTVPALAPGYRSPGREGFTVVERIPI